jgi:HSP20 family protein
MYPRFVRPNLWQEMDDLQREMNRLFETTSAGHLFSPASYPALNVWTKEDAQIISAELPGFTADDINIDVTGDALSISGARKPEETPRDATYHRRERGFGSFSRTIQLPFMVDTNKVDAQFKDGVLLVTLPRAEADKPKKVAITAQ